MESNILLFCCCLFRPVQAYPELLEKALQLGTQKPGSFTAVYWLNDVGQISENLKLSFLICKIKILDKQSHKCLDSPKILEFSQT